MSTYVVNCSDTAFGSALERVLRDVLAGNPGLMAKAGVAVMRGEDFAARVEADARHAREGWSALKKRRRYSSGKS